MVKTSEPIIKKLQMLLEQNYPIWIMYLDIIKFHEVEFRNGYTVSNQILKQVEEEILNTLQEQQHLFVFNTLENRIGDDFVVYLVPGETTPWKITELADTWVSNLENRINASIKKLTPEQIRLRSGLVICENQPGRSTDYLLYTAVKEAFLLNKSERDPLYFARREEIVRLLKEPDRYLKSAFQPIVDVQSGKIYGFEAFARLSGPTSFNNIAELFPFAEKVGLLYPIETLCRRKAISSSSAVLYPKEVLFLNINPQVLADPEFATGQTRKLLAEQGLQPSDVVLELTERSAIQDFVTFRKALEHYRNQGYLIALDDVGAGYSSLQSIAELHPDILKIDRSLISQIHTDSIKWTLLETFITFSKRIGCQVLAEGIETEEELRAVVLKLNSP